MGLLSSTVSMTRYKVEGKLEQPIIENIAKRLKNNAISETDDDVSEKVVGWTSFENPFKPNFEGSSFVIGTHLIFSMRIDKKSIPSKLIKKHYTLEMAKQLIESGRQYLSRNEKKLIKEHVINVLGLRIPATPNIYDLIWNYEESSLWFFSNLKNPNEELETLFSKSFNLNLIRLFPFTMADMTMGLSDSDRDAVSKLSPTKFTE
ncbi:MAG: recombination-associated protein RdgC [Desulfobacterales bacterium]|nr:recombination-associated protein RdgC [Desulfobacterales bacterium]